MRFRFEKNYFHYGYITTVQKLELRNYAPLTQISALVWLISNRKKPSSIPVKVKGAQANSHNYDTEVEIEMNKGHQAN